MSNPALIEIDRLLATARFRHFVELMWPAVSSDPFQSGYHVEAICEHLQAVAENKIKRLALNVAVRHSKSLLCSVLFPAWLWARDQSERIITSTYSQQLTVRDAVRSRQLLESNLYKTYFPPVSFVDDSNRKDFYANLSKGHRLSVSLGSRTAGFDASKVVADDLQDIATRNSQAERDKVEDYFETALCSRLVYNGREGIVLAGHRTHDDDIFGRLRAKYGDSGDWAWLVLPEEFSPKFSTWFNGVGWRDKRQEGELLWPERFSSEVLAGERKRYRHEFSAIFNQEPTAKEGTLFKREWFKHYTEDETHYYLGTRRVAKAGAWRIATVDTAVSVNPEADFTVCQVWDLIGNNLILVHQLRKRLDGVKIVPALTEIWNTYQPQFLAVEKQFVGQFVCDQLRNQNILVKPFDAKKHGDKETRAISGEIRLEAGQVWFPSDKSWVADLESELLAFPHGLHDDQCFIAGTFIETNKGSKPIETISVGDMVLTRKGYRKVAACGFTGVKPTITLRADGVI